LGYDKYMSNPLNTLKLYKTEPHACSYLEDTEATTLFVDPHANIDQDSHTFLSEHGFRRSGAIIYKPDCMNCQECISIRIATSAYTFSRRERRIINRNTDLQAFEVEHIHQDVFFNLYSQYIIKRHADGDMYPPLRDQYEQFFTNPFGNTRFIAFTLDNEIKAVSVIDHFNSGLSAVYTFFDPDDNKRGLGTYVILWQIMQAQAQQLPYVYLGYWVRNCRKMSYKTHFSPYEIFYNKRWIKISDKEN